MIQAEVAATSDEEKLKVFTEFMENEYFIRGERYPTALGEPPSRQGSVFGGALRSLDSAPPSTGIGRSTEAPIEHSEAIITSDVVPPLFSGNNQSSSTKQPYHQAHQPAKIPTPVQEVAIEPPPPKQQTPKPVEYDYQPQEEYRQPQPPKQQTPKPVEYTHQPQQEEYKPPEKVDSYQAFYPGASVPSKPPQAAEEPTPSQDGYKAFNPTIHQSPPRKTASPGPNQHQNYVPFRRPSDPPVSPPLGHIPYGSGRASATDTRGSQPASKRRSVIYPPPARAQTMASPTEGALPPEPGPLKRVGTGGDYWGPRPQGTATESIGGPSAKNKVLPFPAEFPADFPVSSLLDFPPESNASKRSEEYFTPSQEKTSYDELKVLQGPAQPPLAPTPSAPATTALTGVLPAGGVHRPKSTTVLDDILKTITEVGENFSFIDEINAQYKESSKKRQQKLDEERKMRREEHEEYTDRLFADQEIGYGDINEMDTTFNEEEAAKEAKEEEAEYGRYCSDVFQKVYDKLQEGIKGLMDKYFQTMNNIQSAVSGKDRWTRIDGLELTELLEGLLELRGYIERRHEKVQEAILERDRRYRKTVIQPLYAAGNIKKMKTMGQHFDESEKTT